MTEPSLFDLHPPLMANPTSETSKAAAVRAEDFADDQRERVYRAIVASGAKGLSQKECEAETSIKRHSLTFRFRELELDGRIAKVPATIRDGCHCYRPCFVFDGKPT